MNNIKVVLIGDTSVGKTSIADRFVNNQFSEFNEPTIGAAFLAKNLNNIRFEIWDTAGQERYNALIPMYVRDADYVILTFDLTNYVSFMSLKKWIDFGRDNFKNRYFVLVGCKNDLEMNYCLSDEDIEKFRQENIPEAKFFKCSSMTGENIHELFLHVKMSLEKLGEHRIRLNSMNFKTDEKVINLDDYNELFSDKSYVDIVGIKKKCCF